MLMHDKDKYDTRVREYVEKFAKDGGAKEGMIESAKEEAAKEEGSEASELSETSDVEIEKEESD